LFYVILIFRVEAVFYDIILANCLAFVVKVQSMDEYSHQTPFIITLGEQTWIVSSDGSWQPFIDGMTLPEGISQDLVIIDDIQFDQGVLFATIGDSWLKVPNDIVFKGSLIDNNIDTETFNNSSISKETQSSNQPSENSNPGQEGLNFFYQTVKRSGDELISKSGFDSLAAQEQVDNVNTPTDNPDTLAEITLEVRESCSGTDDGEIYDLFGQVDDVEDGNVVIVTVSDNQGNSKVFTTSIVDSAWEINDADLTGLVDGELTVEAQTSDDSGNQAFASTTLDKDTFAQITINVDTNADTIDNTINAAEVEHVNISGTVSGVEDGQTVTVTVTDENNNSLEFTTEITNGSWQITDADISPLIDSPLTYSATVTDQHCNTAVTQTNTEKDTQANISVLIESGDDQYLTIEETTPVIITGTVSDVEPGQIVTIVLNNSQNDQDTLTAMVQADLSYSASVDISNYAIGEITAHASVFDVAGNPATAVDTATTEFLGGGHVVITLSVNTREDTVDNIINAAEVGQVDIKGLVHNVEDGQSVKLTISDGVNSLHFTTTVSGTSWAINNLDLSLLNDGDLTYLAQVTNNDGASGEAQVIREKDTIAKITIAVNTSEDVVDNVVNSTEARGMIITGTVTDVENGQTITVSVTDGSSTLDFTTLVAGNSWQINDADLTALTDGTLTYTANVTDVAGNPATDSITSEKDTQANISIVVDTNADMVDNSLNAAEVGQVDITGTVTEVENGQTITISVSDGSNTLNFTTQVSGNSWGINDADLTSLADGSLSYTASVSDVAGNEATDSITAEKDTHASIDVIIASGIDEYLLAGEIAPLIISGTVTGVEAGQEITLVLSNANGDTDTITTFVDNDLTYSTSLDISGYAEGLVTAVASVSDKAGNPATNADTATIDRLASITIVVDTNADTVDNILNAAEIGQVDISGTVANVENGRTITVSVSDGSSVLDFTTLVSGNSWNIDDANLTSLADGTLTYDVSVSDVAGNIATDSITTEKNTFASINVVIASGVDEFLLAGEIAPLTLSGTVDNVEIGQEITLVLSNANGDTDTITTSVANDFSYLTTIDISGYAEGVLTVSVSVSDDSGNLATNTDTATIDRLASITIVVDTNADTVDNTLNAAEIGQVGISGTVSNVDNGQTITVSVTDGSTTLDFTTLVLGNSWNINDADLTALSDDTLTYDVSVSDVAGNIATDSITTEKDTQASITLVVDTNADTADNTLNVAEIAQVDFSGTVANVGDGRTITVSVSDGSTTLDFTTLVSGNDWNINDADLTALSDGTLTFDVSATDLAGNIATDSITSEKDTQASIEVLIDSGIDDYLLAGEIAPLTISGTVISVEVGQEITLVLSNANGDTNTVTTTVGNDFSYTTTIDVSGYAEGLLTVVASVNDDAGNSATNTDTATIDRVIDIDIDTGVAGLDVAILRANGISQFEGATNAEVGQAVIVSISDGSTTKEFIGSVDGVGHWLVTGIDIGGLDNQVVWQITATVTDIAGNTAVDDMPDIDILRTSILRESIVALTGADTSSQPIDITNAVVSLSSDQTSLSTLTSNLSPVTVVLAGDAQSLTVTRDSDGATVMTVALQLNEIKITLFEPVDQQVGDDYVFETFALLEAVQTDTDGTLETITLPVYIDLHDAPPVAIDDHYIVVEDTSSSGSLIGNDFTNEGPLKVTSVEIDGIHYAIPDGGNNVINVLPYGVLTVGSNGYWTLDVANNLDHDLLQQFELIYSAMENDGSDTKATAVFTINDGVAGTMADVTSDNTEANFDETLLQTTNFELLAGSDTLVADSIAFDASETTRVQSLNLTSNNDLITYQFSNNDKTLTATANGSTVFTLTISAVSNGDDLTATTVFEQFSPLDHISSDVLNLVGLVTASDIDGTAIVSGEYNLIIRDGNNPQLANISNVTLDESLLGGGAQTASGLISSLIGSDKIASVEFSAIGEQPELTVNGVTVNYQLSGDGKTLTGFIGDVSDPVFVAQLSNNFSSTDDTLNDTYDFTLYQPLDQNVSSDIPLKVTITDLDGDSSTNSLDITIIDDTGATITAPSLAVSELPQDFSTHKNFDLGLVLTEAGIDALVDLDYDVVNGSPVLDSNGAPLTQNNQVISWFNLNNGTLEGRLASGAVIFKVTVEDSFTPSPANKPISFVLYSPVDHINSQADSLILFVPLVLIDQDGSRTITNMSVQIDDGLNASITTPGTAGIVDEGLLVNNAQVNTTGSYEVDPGSDEVVEVVIAEGFVFSGVSVHSGANVSLAATPDGNNWFIATADDDASEVFRIRFNPDGSYEYQQFQALDHINGDGENQLVLNFTIQAIDADGDKSVSQNLTVVVQDDVPLSADINVDLAEGDVIDIALLTNTTAGADGAIVSQVTYLGVDYLVDAGTGVNITLFDNSGTPQQYGQLQVNADGTATLTSNEFSGDSLDYLDSLLFEVIDGDNDIVTNTLNIDIRDNTGAVEAINPTTDEDTPVTLLIRANPGDLDLNEEITEIRINIASLNGGSLTLAGSTIPDDGTDYILSGSLLLIDGDGVAIPNGILVFTPALNTSDAIAAQAVTINVAVQIEANGTPKPLVFTTIDVTINSVADLPLWDDGYSTYTYNAGFDGSIVEDGPAVAITLKADLFDGDTSEVITYRIEGIDSRLELHYNDAGTNKTVNNGDVLTQIQLDSLTATSIPDSAGLMTFSVIAIATEQDNGDVIEQNPQLISINVQPVADIPELTVKSVHSDEDVAINVNQFIAGLQSDGDGSELLSVELTLPTGWVLNGLNGAVVTDLGGGVWSAQGIDVAANNVELIPLADISSVNTTFSIAVQGISTDTPANGGVPVAGAAQRSEIKTVTVTLTGVIDPPGMEANANWDFDESTLTISNSATFDEDNNVPLDFAIITSDDDGSEIISLTITGFPDGFSLVDAGGDDAGLNVVGFDNNQPVYSVTADQLQTLLLQSPADYSGLVSLTITVMTTEPDGASGQYDITLDVTVNPVIDENIASLASSANGTEDQSSVIDFSASLTLDNDGSEIVTAVVITAIPADTKLILDGSEYSGTLDLAVLATSLGLTLTEFLDSGRLGLLSPQDATGTYAINIEYTVVDTSPEGDSTPQVFATISEVVVYGKVDEQTRFETPVAILTSNDGTLDLTGQVGFSDDDIDGSEVLDYIVLIMPSNNGWLVTHPNGALPDGDGRWLIPIDGSLTSDSIQENNVDVLAGVTLISDDATAGPVTIQVAGRVTDQTDQDAIFADFEVEFTAGVADSSAGAITALQQSAIDGSEDSTISFAGHFNASLTVDANDDISFRILASDLPEGATLSGAGVHIVNKSDGKSVFEYLFNQAALDTLVLSSAGEDFSGILDIPIRIIATDPLSGDTTIDDSQLLQLDITPVADGVELMPTDVSMNEDVALPLGLHLTYLDTDLAADSGGQEVVFIDSDPNNNLTITLLDGGSLVDYSGMFTLKAGTTDTWQFTGSSQAELTAALALVGVQATEHLAGDALFRIQVSGTMIDSALMLAGEVSVTDTFSSIVSVDVSASTDFANLSTSDSQGNEDSAISLAALTAELIDQDGSEVISLSITGVPSGAILAVDADGPGGAEPVILPNNGEDGGTFAGQPTYSWSVSPAQLANVVLIPALDFNGDIELTLQAITKDVEPGDYVTTDSSFLVSVNPVGDGADAYILPDALYDGDEDQTVTIDLGAVGSDTNGDEKIQITVHITSSSDASALIGISGVASITVAASTVLFSDDGSGGYFATLLTSSNEISSFDFNAGNLAWGTFDMSVDVATVDTAEVNGSLVSNTSPVQSFAFEVELIPEVDAPIWLSYGDISVTDPDNIPLNLDIELQNPAFNEQGYLRVSGLDAGLTLNYGAIEGSDWIVPLDQVSDLQVIGASSGDDFTLILTPYTELDGDSEEGETESIDVVVAAAPPGPPAAIIFAPNGLAQAESSTRSTLNDGEHNGKYNHNEKVAEPSDNKALDDNAMLVNSDSFNQRLHEELTSLAQGSEGAW
jgi:T1SS-143 domain-containing protein